MSKIIEFSVTPITDITFERQGWTQHIEEDDDGESFYYWTLRLPKNKKGNDAEIPQLISNANDEYHEVGVKEGQYIVQLLVVMETSSSEMYGLGICKSEEEIEILYRALTGENIYD